MQANHRRSQAVRLGASATAAALLCASLTALPAASVPSTPGSLPVSDNFRPAADIGFHDYTRTGEDRAIRNDLVGDLSGMVELAQASTANPTGNSAAELPTTVAERTALLLFTPTSATTGVRVKVEAKGTVFGTLDLAHPNVLPKADQSFDSRGSVSYSLRAWSVELPSTWVQPGLKLTFTDESGNSGNTEHIDIAAPTELVINNIRLGMVAPAPVGNGQRFLNNPASGATDYFHTIPISKLTMAMYEDVNLEQVIVNSGAIYNAENQDPSPAGVYAGTMRENVGKAQVSTGINLATWGITSSPMNQRQPGHTNQRVIHHSAGLYKNHGVVSHGLSGGNGMATLYNSVGNELSHELGHSYGLGHYPGRNGNLTGDDRIRNASHHMDSGWGYIDYRNLMRSNLNTGGYREVASINNDPFLENLQGKYNFNTDTMAGGWDASPVSDYTHMTGYSLKRTQNSLKQLVADLDYPSGYRSWDNANGEWADAKVLNPNFNLLKPKTVGTHVYTILGGYNPAVPEQTLVYPAFRSNYGVTFDLPQADPQSTAEARACWLEVEFASADTQYIQLDPSNGVKQLNVHIAQDEEPTAAQVNCRAGGETTELGNQIAIANDQEPLPDPVIVGQEHGNEALRAQELAALSPKLEGMSSQAAPVLSGNDLVVLRGWADDLSGLSTTAREVANRILELDQIAQDLSAYIAQHPTDRATVEQFLESKGFLEADGSFLPQGSKVTVHNGACLYLKESSEGVLSVHVDGNRSTCATAHDDLWFTDAGGRIHSTEFPQYCLVAGSPVSLGYCNSSDSNQRWIFQDNGQVIRSNNTRQALDFFVHKEYPGIYNSTGNSNQIWNGFTQTSNPLIAKLDSSGLRALWTVLATPADEQPPVSEEYIADPPAFEEFPADSGSAIPAPGDSEGGPLGSTPGSGSPSSESGPSESSPPSSTPEGTAPGSGTPGSNAPADGAPQAPAGPEAADQPASEFSPENDALPNHIGAEPAVDEDNVDNDNPHAGKPNGVEDHSGHDHGPDQGHDELADAQTPGAGGAPGADGTSDAADGAGGLASTGTSVIAGIIALLLVGTGAAFMYVRRLQS